MSEKAWRNTLLSVCDFWFDRKLASLIEFQYKSNRKVEQQAKSSLNPCVHNHGMSNFNCPLVIRGSLYHSCSLYSAPLPFNSFGRLIIDSCSFVLLVCSFPALLLCSYIFVPFIVSFHLCPSHLFSCLIQLIFTCGSHDGNSRLKTWHKSRFRVSCLP